MNIKNKRKILVLYTGGTAGMQRKGEGRLAGWSPGSLDDLRANIPALADLPYDIVYEEFRLDGELIDSSNANYELYNDLSSAIAERYKEYDGYVVLFGTDTMAPSAGAISYLLEGIAKPVVFTGSMHPASEPGSDAPKNIIDAINVAARTGTAGIPPLRDVAIVIAGQIWRAVSSVKNSASNEDAFNRFNREEPLLGEISGDDISMNPERMMPADAAGPRSLHKFTSHDQVFPIIRIPGDIANFETLLQLIKPHQIVFISGLGISADSEHVRLMKKYLSPTQVVAYLHEDPPPDSDWIHLSGIVDYQQAMIKLSFVASVTQDNSERRTLIESNLRGEKAGKLRSESEVLQDNRSETREPTLSMK